MTFIVSTKNTPQGFLVVITDKNIFGKSFSQGKLKLDLKDPFYQGSEMKLKEIEKLVEDAYLLHLTGEKIVTFAKKKKWVDPKKILYVDKVPHAQVLLRL